MVPQMDLKITFIILVKTSSADYAIITSARNAAQIQTPSRGDPLSSMSATKCWRSGRESTLIHSQWAEVDPTTSLQPYSPNFFCELRVGCDSSISVHGEERKRKQKNDT